MDTPYKYTFDDEVSVPEMTDLMRDMKADTSGPFPAEAIFHYPLRNDKKEAVALQNGINVTARNEDGLLIGYLRVVSDRAYIHYIVDVMVLPQHQGARVGSQLLDVTLETLKKSGFIKIILTAIPGKEDFYKRMGFKQTMSPILALRGEDYPVPNENPLFPSQDDHQ